VHQKKIGLLLCNPLSEEEEDQQQEESETRISGRDTNNLILFTSSLM
jgi:hypothetical protein